MNTPHPDLETLAELADRDDLLASEPPATGETPAAAPAAVDPQTAEILAHVAGCAACTADLEALRRVRETLRALPPVPMPAEVAERIEAALLAARDSALPPAVAGAGVLEQNSAGQNTAGQNTAEQNTAAQTAIGQNTVVPLRSRSQQRSGSASSRWRTMPYGAAASIVVVLALLTVGIIALGNSSNDSKKSASAPAAAATTSAAAGGTAPATIASGTNYTSADLRSQVAAVVTSNVPGAAANFPGLDFGVAAGSAAVPAAAAASSAPAAATSAGPASAPSAAASSAAAAPSFPAAAPSASASAAAAPASPPTGGADIHAASTPVPAVTAPAGPLADPAALASCIEVLAGKAEQPLLVDYATFNGAPSTIIVLPDPDVAHKLDIYVEANTSNCANQVFTFETFLGPSAGP